MSERMSFNPQEEESEKELDRVLPDPDVLATLPPGSYWDEKSHCYVVVGDIDENEEVFTC